MEINFGFSGLPGDAIDSTSMCFCLVVLLFVGYSVWNGDVDIFHLHHQVYNTHQINTVAAVLSVLFTLICSALIRQRDVVLASKQVPLAAQFYPDTAWWALLWHVLAYLFAHATAVLYKIVIICYKAKRYRSMTNATYINEQRARNASPKRILIVHASVGSGHKRAAQAIEEEIKAKIAVDPGRDDYVVNVLDIVETQEWFLRTVYKQAFMSLVSKDYGQAFIGFMFEKSNEAAPMAPDNGYIQTLLEEAFMLSFVEYLLDFRPDIIINTHFLGLKVISHLRTKVKAFNVPQVCAVTDFDVHAYWACTPCEQFFVARDECRHALVQMGISENSIKTFGMPIVPAFKTVRTKKKCLKDLELDGSLPIILLMSGEDDVFDTYKALLNMDEACQIALICGRQGDIRKELGKINVPSHHKVKLEGFTRVMHEYLACADMIITKVSEPAGFTETPRLLTFIL